MFTVCAATFFYRYNIPGRHTTARHLLSSSASSDDLDELVPSGAANHVAYATHTCPAMCSHVLTKSLKAQCISTRRFFSFIIGFLTACCPLRSPRLPPRWPWPAWLGDLFFRSTAQIFSQVFRKRVCFFFCECSVLLQRCGQRFLHLFDSQLWLT